MTTCIALLAANHF